MSFSKVNSYISKIPSTDGASRIKITVSNGISSLFFYGSPLTIFRGIIAIIINPVNAVFRRWRSSHIFEEVFKRMKPTVANLYSTTTITMKQFIFRIITSKLNTYPSTICFRFTHSMSCASMSNIFHYISMIASAAYRFLCCKRTPVNNHNISARTFTLPPDFFFPVRCSFNNGKSSKSLAGKVFKCWHNNLQAKVASIKGYVASWMLEAQRFGSYPSHYKNITYFNGDVKC